MKKLAFGLLHLFLLIDGGIKRNVCYFSDLLKVILHFVNLSSYIMKLLKVNSATDQSLSD